ncbi:hypothetical protein EI94DRAFT_1701933 [Lactarius quietus]|nr:hypothetical protein EI94DRAFT_1701933 [Lactarius quietus]
MYYARGILFGKMVMELGDACTAHNGGQDLHTDLEFKTKGFFSRTLMRSLGASGMVTGEKRTPFDAQKNGSAIAPNESCWRTHRTHSRASDSGASLRALCLRKTWTPPPPPRAQSRTRSASCARLVLNMRRGFNELRDNRWAPHIQLPSDLQGATAADRRGHGPAACEGGATATTYH